MGRRVGRVVDWEIRWNGFEGRPRDIGRVGSPPEIQDDGGTMRSSSVSRGPRSPGILKTIAGTTATHRPTLGMHLSIINFAKPRPESERKYKNDPRDKAPCAMLDIPRLGMASLGSSQCNTFPMSLGLFLHRSGGTKRRSVTSFSVGNMLRCLNLEMHRTNVESGVRVLSSKATGSRAVSRVQQLDSPQGFLGFTRPMSTATSERPTTSTSANAPVSLDVTATFLNPRSKCPFPDGAVGDGSPGSPGSRSCRASIAPTKMRRRRTAPRNARMYCPVFRQEPLLLCSPGETVDSMKEKKTTRVILWCTDVYGPDSRVCKQAAADGRACVERYASS